MNAAAQITKYTNNFLVFDCTYIVCQENSTEPSFSVSFDHLIPFSRLNDPLFRIVRITLSRVIHGKCFQLWRVIRSLRAHLIQTRTIRLKIDRVVTANIETVQFQSFYYQLLFNHLQTKCKVYEQIMEYSQKLAD